MKWILEFGQELTDIYNAEQMREELFSIHNQVLHDPVIVFINAPDGSRLAVGLGLERSVLNYIAKDGWPSCHAIDTNVGNGFLTYKLAGQDTEVPINGTVPMQDAINACMVFVRTGKLTDSFEWQED